MTITSTPMRTAVVQRMWDTFATDRAHLYDQYQAIAYDPASGRAPDELAKEIDAYLAAHAELPHITLKAHVFAHLLTHSQIALDPLDWFPDKFNHGQLLRPLRLRWMQEARGEILGDAATWFDALAELGLGRAALDTGHISAGWRKMFDLGLEGLGAEARAQRGQCAASEVERIAFYDAVETVCDAAIALSQRFAVAAEEASEEYSEYTLRLQTIAACCRRVPAQPPRTLHEALYFAWLMHELIELEGEAVRSLGRLDQMLYPYYVADLESGRLDRQQAMELFQYYWIKSTARTRGTDNGAHFCLGGQLSDGTDAANGLTDLILDAYEALNAPDPKLSVRIFAGTSDRLYRRVLGMIRAGHNAMVLINDEAAVPALVKRGKTLEDARQYLPIGCYEPAVDGLEAACTTNLVVNLAKGIELALYNGIDPSSGRRVGPRTGELAELADFDAVLRAYLAQIDAIIARSAAAIAQHERLWPELNPSPLIAATLDDCLTRGLDVGQGGCRYNAVGCVGTGLANAADSLLAIRCAVYEDKRCTLEEIVEALAADFQGHEALRAYLINRPPKWGNGDPLADELARRVADHYCAKIHSYRSERGGPYQAALYSFTFQWDLGEHTGALPDGKLATKPLAPGVGAMAGRDRAGVTALLGSVGKLDFTETPNGSVLDVRLHPSSVAGEAGLDALTSLVRTFFDAGGFALQFNILDSETLRKAQAQPQEYATLQVRVAGYSAYFVNLSREMQDHLIAQHTHQL